MRGSKNFCQGGGGGGGGGWFQARRPDNSMDNVCFSPQFILQSTEGGGGWSNDFLQRKLYFSKDPEGVQHFPGVQLFPGGIQMLISIETHITCEFPGGGSGPPIPPSPFGSANAISWLWLLVFCVSSSP